MKKMILEMLLILGVVIMSGCEINIKKVQITAHRGASGLAPENTMVAIVKASTLFS